MDLISVIMPFYKKREFFEESLLSVINQTYKNIELIIIYDDYKADDLTFIKDKIKFHARSKVINNKQNYGVAKARNIGIENSGGEFIAFIDSDDLWDKNKLEIQYNHMKKNNSRISHTNYKIIDKNNNLLGINIAKDNLNYQELINSCDIGLSTVMIQKDVFKISMFKNIKTKEDYALWLELARNGEKFSALNLNLSSYRKTSNSLSSSFKNKLVNGFIVYNKYEKKNLFISFFLVINLGLNYIKKTFKQKINKL
tara:strand:- start:1 stop:765 length:765 start_codon:yes stop_codon:yes gene_type:complete